MDSQEDAFCIMNLEVVRGQLARWRHELPRVDPWFAVKCCPDKGVMRTLALGGCGFDVASQWEMEQALSMPNASPDRLIYANPCKQPSHIRASYKYGVNVMTLDNVEELRKIIAINPNARLVVRILGDDSSSVCRFNVKFGIAVEELAPLLREASKMNANVVGVSFHVGSGCRSADAFVSAVENARAAFDMFPACGLPEPKFLDLGGGWPGDLVGCNGKDTIAFEDITSKLRPALDRLFPQDVQIIAEPGRYFVHAAATLFVNVTSKRRVQPEGEAGELVDVSGDSSGDSSGEEEDASHSRTKRSRMNTPGPMASGFRYYVNDGVYGSFNCMMYDHRDNLNPTWLLNDKGDEMDKTELTMLDCSVFGNTCDGIDRISASCALPDIPIGTWFVYDNMGAYTIAASSNFNGFPLPKTLYVGGDA